MKDLVDVIDELDEVIWLLWAAFMAASDLDGPECGAMRTLLNNIRKSAERARADLDNVQSAERARREAA